ncbi:NAD-dependent epimerase/dehydratase family protein, partial [Burkholderia multivorans]
MNHRALIVGASGIVGRALADRLLSSGWTVYGLSRGRTASVPGCQPVVADLTSAESVAAATQNIEVSHVFFTAWARQATEKENIRVNGAMVRNVLDSLGRRTKLEHA